jgi:tetratricopeptide (TPR) repeat protein
MQLAGAMLERLGWLAREQGDSATAWRWMTESLALSREVGDTAGVAGTLVSMAGIAIVEEDPARAEALLAESGALAQHVTPDAYAWTLNHLGNAAQLRGDYARAAQLHRDSLALFSSDYHAGIRSAYHCLGESALGLGQLEEAARWLRQGLALSRRLNAWDGMAWCLAGLGSVAALDEEPEHAARLWGAAESLRQTIGCRPAPAARATYERAIASARAQLGEEAFAAAWAAGRAMTLEQAIAYALEGSTGDVEQPVRAVATSKQSG